MTRGAGSGPLGVSAGAYAEPALPPGKLAESNSGEAGTRPLAEPGSQRRASDRPTRSGRVRGRWMSPGSPDSHFAGLHRGGGHQRPCHRWHSSSSVQANRRLRDCSSFSADLPCPWAERTSNSPATDVRPATRESTPSSTPDTSSPFPSSTTKSHMSVAGYSEVPSSSSSHAVRSATAACSRLCSAFMTRRVPSPRGPPPPAVWPTADASTPGVIDAISQMGCAHRPFVMPPGDSGRGLDTVALPTQGS